MAWQQGPGLFNFNKVQLNYIQSQGDLYKRAKIALWLFKLFILLNSIDFFQTE